MLTTPMQIKRGILFQNRVPIIFYFIFSRKKKKPAPLDEQLEEACRNSDKLRIKYFMREIKPSLTRDTKPLLNSCLLTSIDAGLLDICKLLLDNGAVVDGLDSSVLNTNHYIISFYLLVLQKEKVPLIWALERQKLDIARILLEQYRANPNNSRGHAT
jgi:hypothetical protein